MAQHTALLRGGARDGQTTTVDQGVRRLVTTSDAPGLMDIYEQRDEEVELPDHGLVVVFELVGQEPATGFAPEMQTMPHSPPG